METRRFLSVNQLAAEDSDEPTRKVDYFALLEAQEEAGADATPETEVRVEIPMESEPEPEVACDGLDPSLCLIYYRDPVDPDPQDGAVLTGNFDLTQAIQAETYVYDDPFEYWAVRELLLGSQP